MAPTDTPTLEARLRAGLLAARKAGDRTAASALRSALGAIDNAGAVAAVGLDPDGGGAIAGATAGVGATEVARREASEDELVAIVRAEVAERHDAAVAAARGGRAEDAERLRAEAAVLVAHLPPG